jgi:hypothetical protein
MIMLPLGYHYPSKNFRSDAGHRLYHLGCGMAFWATFSRLGGVMIMKEDHRTRGDRGTVAS